MLDEYNELSKNKHLISDWEFRYRVLEMYLRDTISNYENGLTEAFEKQLTYLKLFTSVREIELSEEK